MRSGVETLFARWLQHSYMLKELQKSSSPEPVADSHETLYVVLGTPAHHSLIK